MNDQASIPFNWRSPFDLNHPTGGMLSGLAAGLIAGVVIGVAARIGMRIVALTSGAVPIFTINGTFTILKCGAIFGIIVGIIFGFFQPFYRGSVIKKGAKYGLILSTVMVMLLFANSEGSADVRALFILPLFAILPLIYGLLLSWIIIRLIPKDQIKGNEIVQNEETETARKTQRRNVQPCWAAHCASRNLAYDFFVTARLALPRTPMIPLPPSAWVRH